MDQDEFKTIKEKLMKWNESTKHLDTSFFLDFNSDILLINGQKAPDVMIQFNLANQYGCRVTIHKLDNTSVVFEAQVFYKVLAKGHGYFSRRSRDIKITYGKKTLTGKLPINVEISLPSWLDSCIFVIGFYLEDLDKTQVIKSEHNYCSKSVLNINVFQYNSEVILENGTIRWCFIDINPEDLITIDVEKFENIVKEFETVIGDLHFTISVANEEQRKLDHEALEQDISDMNKFLDQIKGERISDIKPVNINPDDLLDPEETDRRGTKPKYIYKKIYKFCEVACKPIVIPKDYDIKAQRFYVRFAILGKLRESPNILKFFGLSYLEGNIVMINEWTEMGTLREVYEKYDITWFAKVHIATDICRGITFLHSCDILHHDIRCENILMTRNLEPKITKFEYSSYVNRDEGLFKMTNDNVFGMTLWELVFEKIPYGHWDIGKIINHVISGKREQISFGDAPEDIQRLQQELKLIIISAWQDDPELRASLQQIFLQLSTLARIYQKPLSSPALLPPNTLDLDGSKKKIYDSSSNEGCKTAWECFEAHANLGNTVAKYWMGFYLWKGLLSGKKDRKRASELFKEAADDGISHAQLRYAFSLVNNPPIKFNRAIFLDYLNKAAENNNPTAQFNLGDMYLNGKLKVEKNEQLGIKYLRLAALNNQPKAIEILKRLGINIYIDQQD
ncbi:kinase-like protein [Gigaspora margarita]|uniref:Kinase-like protein n=1 Tax=Gigaspora margarita TaxID=4874 RepID=A0A8H4ATW0_GIGMA|nr:kinase-like protein [Gigaspora margarita]